MINDYDFFFGRRDAKTMTFGVKMDCKKNIVEDE